MTSDARERWKRAWRAVRLAKGPGPSPRCPPEYAARLAAMAIGHRGMRCPGHEDRLVERLEMSIAIDQVRVLRGMGWDDRAGENQIVARAAFARAYRLPGIPFPDRLWFKRYR